MSSANENENADELNWRVEWNEISIATVLLRFIVF